MSSHASVAIKMIVAIFVKSDGVALSFSCVKRFWIVIAVSRVDVLFDGLRVGVLVGVVDGARVGVPVGVVVGSGFGVLVGVFVALSDRCGRCCFSSVGENFGNRAQSLSFTVC